jgi:hypothetical protein
MKTLPSTPGALFARPAPRPNTNNYSEPLPVHIDIEWLGCTMTLPNGGIITRDSVIEPNHLSL